MFALFMTLAPLLTSSNITTTSIVTAEPPDMAGACPANYWVAVRGEAATSCPTLVSTSGNWQPALLFDPADLSTTGASLSINLRRYCTYAWSSPSNTPPDTTVFSNSAVLKNAAPDCQVVAPLGSATYSANWQALADAYATQIDALNVMPLTSGIQPTHVAIVDSSPTVDSGGFAVQGLSPHGHSVGRIVRRLACPAPYSADSACLAYLTHHLALPKLDTLSTNYATGGHFGTQSQLGYAIQNALAQGTKRRSRHLIINLSVGWDPRYGGDFAGSDWRQLNAPAQSVYAAIHEAACAGVLVVAAAGNDTGGPQPTSGPLYPAAWETQPAPSAEACTKARSSQGLVSALLVSVGGVQGKDLPLGIGREAGRPQLAAPARLAVVSEDADSTTPADPLTGTSAAAAVVSGIAAAVWAYRPDLSARDVVSEIYAAGVGLQSTADYCTGGAACSMRIHRVGLCPTLQLACTNAEGLCPPTPSFERCVARAAFEDAGPTLNADAQLSLAIAGFPLIEAAPTIFTIPPEPVCGANALFNSVDSMAAAPCPERQFFGVAAGPWTLPQPTAPPCPACPALLSTSGGSATFFLDIDDAFQGVLTEATLNIPGCGHVSLNMAPALVAGGQVELRDVPMPACDLSGANLSFQVLGGADTGSVVNPVIFGAAP